MEKGKKSREKKGDREKKCDWTGIHLSKREKRLDRKVEKREEWRP
jgi:hypothetical protein